MYPTRQLITRAYWLAGIVARDLQQVTGSQETEGLFLLNMLLDVKGSDTRLIPYYTHYEFPLEPGKEDYFIPGLIDVQTMTFNLGVVRFGMESQTRNEYFGQSRVDNISSLPFTRRAEREKGGMRIWVYFNPAQEFTAKIMGKFALTDVTLDEDLSVVYDNYYLEYLRYALAEYLCNEYTLDFPEGSRRKFDEIRKKLVDISPPDLSVKKLRYAGGSNAINWGVINLSQGYLPPGGGR